MYIHVYNYVYNYYLYLFTESFGNFMMMMMTRDEKDDDRRWTDRQTNKQRDGKTKRLMEQDEWYTR